MFKRRSKQPATRKPVELAPFPAIALRVLQLATEPDASPTRIAGVVRADAAISARVLRLANSSLYGFRQRIDTLSAASMALGAKKLVEVTIASTVSLYHAPRGHLTSDQSQLLWRRSIGSAFAAQQAAPGFGVDPSRAFFAGLFLPIGLLRFHQVYPLRVIDRIRRFYGEGLSGPEAQRRVFGLDFLQEGGRLVRDWDLPVWIATSMEQARAFKPTDLIGTCLRRADVAACTLLEEDGVLAEEDRWSVDMPAVLAALESEAQELSRADLRERTSEFDFAA